MSAVAEPLASSTHDEKHFEGVRLAQAKPELEPAIETDHAAAAASAASPPPPSDPLDDLPMHQVIQLLRSPAPGHAANSSTRSSAARRIQRTIGNRATQQVVMRAHTVQRQCACGGTCAKCQEEEQQRQVQRAVQRASASHAPAEFDGVPASTGEQLDPATRQPMEAHFGADLADVRVHTGAAAAKSATSIDALAYTSGRDIYFASGMYAPSSNSGRRLLAHEVAHVVQQSSGKEPSIATKSSHGAKIGAPDDPLEGEADHAAEEYMRKDGSAATEEQRQKLSASQTIPPIQRAPASGQVAPDSPPMNPVDAILQGIDDDDVDAVVAAMRGRSLISLAVIRFAVFFFKAVYLERWLLRPHGMQEKIVDIASVAVTYPLHRKIRGTAEEGLRLLWPALPLMDRIEIYDEGYREIEQAQLDVIRQSSMEERSEAKLQVDRLSAVYANMSAKEEFEARNLMDSSEIARGDTAVRMIQRGDEDTIYDALLALDAIDRKFVFDQHYDELRHLLGYSRFNLVATLSQASEARAIIARLRLATEDRSDDMDAVRAMVDRAVALLGERQQLREAASSRLLTAADREEINTRLQELGDLDELLQFTRKKDGDLKENTFMALISDAENQQGAFGADTSRLAKFSKAPRAFAMQMARQRVLLAGSNREALTSVLLTTHAPADPTSKGDRTESAQLREDVEFRQELLAYPDVAKVVQGLVHSDQTMVAGAVKGDAFSDAMARLNEMRVNAQWGEFFDLVRTIALKDEWRDRFEETSSDPFGIYAGVFGEERDIMLTILHDPEHKMPITALLSYTGKVSTLKAAFANLQENEREQLREGWALARYPFIGPRTEDQEKEQDSALAAFQKFEEQLKSSQGHDKEGFEEVLAEVLGASPTKKELSSGRGLWNAAAILAERVDRRLGLSRGMAADFTETDETMDAAGREFAALWLRFKDQPELTIVEYATLSTLYQRFETRSQEFTDAEKTITDLAGTIAATLAGIVVVIATGGAATPAVVAMAAAAGAAGGFIAREAFGGDYYTAMSSEGGRALLLDSVNGALAVLSASLAARGVELVGLAGNTLLQGAVRAGEASLQEAASSLGRKVLVSGVEAAFDGAISGSVSEGLATFTDDRTWRHGIMEGLARVGKSALLGGLFGLGGGAILGSAMPVAGRAVSGLWKAVSAGSLEKTLVRAGMEDVLKSAQAAARSGDVHGVELLTSQMEAHLAPEEAALLRQQLREKLAEVLGHPPGRAPLLEGEKELLAASSGEKPVLSVAELKTEHDVVSRSEPQLSNEPGFVDEVDLGNGHTWRRTEDGTWCRFTRKTLCGTKIPGARAMSSEALERAKLIDDAIEALDDALSDAGEKAVRPSRAAAPRVDMQGAIQGALQDMRGQWSGNMANKGTRLHAALARRLKALGISSKITVEIEKPLRNVVSMPSNIRKMKVSDWLNFEGKGGGKAHAWLAGSLDRRVLDTAVGDLELDAMFHIDGRTVVFDLTSQQSASHLAKTTLYTVITTEDNELARIQEYYWARRYVEP
jgi:hypothetical protein